MDQPTHFPKLGETRCYWVLLDAKLRFLFTDPVLTNHLKEQAELVIGRNLLEFIHPDEQENASRDLHVVIQHQAIHGSVTRVKYLRLSQIRVVLGAVVKETFPHAAQVGYDKDYLPCDLVLNWVADNLALCFIHAVIDISPDDNDELLKGRWHWTNWCGTVPFSTEQCALLHNRLVQANLILPPHDVTVITNSIDNSYRQENQLTVSAAAPRRVFQILANSPARRAVFTWPTEGCDANKFGNLASNVRIDTPAQSATASPASSSSIASPSLGSPSLKTTPHEVLRHQRRQQNDPDSPYAEVRTSCTRRYKSQQSFQSEGMLHEVESIFIPHGSVIFACHQVINRRPIGPSFDTLAASSSAAPVFRPQSQQWTLRPSPPALYSLSTDNERHIKRHPLAPSPSSDFPSFSPSHTTPTSASTLSSGYPITPASSDNREWHDWHLDTPSGFSGGAHNVDPKNRTQGISWSDQAHPAPSAYLPISGSWPQSASIVGDSPPAHDQAFSPFSSKRQGGLSAPGSNSRDPSNNRAQALPPLSSIAATHGAGIMPGFYGSSTAQQLPHVSSFGIPSALPPPSQLLSYGSALPPPGELGNSDGVSPFDYGSDYGFRQQVPQGTAATQPPHLGRPHGATGTPPLSDLAPPTVTNPPVATSVSNNTGGRAGGKRGGGSSGLVNGGRVSGNPPAGVTHCAFCGTTTSPEWRKGVTGIKNLCNACGLRYARTKQKEEGHVPNRRRVLGAADIQASPVSVSPPAQGAPVNGLKKRTLSDNDEPNRRIRRPSGSPPNSLSQTSTSSDFREQPGYDYLNSNLQSSSSPPYQPQPLKASRIGQGDMTMTMD